VVIEENVNIEDCIIMDQVVLKKGCRLKKVIVDKLNVIEENAQIGFDTEKDRFRCHIDSSGIAIVPKGGKLIKGSR
jgi:glucose-1-phosphate adenylyltransferase